MDIKKVSDGLKSHVLTPAAKGAIQAVLEQFAAPTPHKSRALPNLALIGVGVLIGAGAALLLSPTTGKEIRAKLMGLAAKFKAKPESDEADPAKPDAKPDGTPEGTPGGNSQNRRPNRPAMTATP